MSAEAKVDVLERILNCGESMRDVHDAVVELIEAASKVWRRGGDVPGSEWDELGNALARVGGAA